MKKLLIFGVGLFLVLLSAKSILAKETEYYIKITAYLVEKGQKKPPSGSGGFTVTENKYGRVSFTYFKNEGQSSITVPGDYQVPVTQLLSEHEPKISANEIFLAADLYLKASPSREKFVHLKGVLIKLTQAENKTPTLFEYSEEKLDFVLPPDGKQTILVNDNYNDKQIYLDITVQVEGELVYKEKISRQVWFATEYYLYNQDAKKYELERRKCTLGLNLDTEDNGSCSQRQAYKLTNGDSLLYIATFQIKNTAFIKPDKIKFLLEVSHIYAINPLTDEIFPQGLKSDKTTVVVLNKEITALTGERTEIEIPQDKESVLPFKSKETLVLINSVKEVKE